MQGLYLVTPNWNDTDRLLAATDAALRAGAALLQYRHKDASALVGPAKIVGASCYGDLALARAARSAGASYLAFGGFYPSPVKQYTFVTPPELLDQARAEFTLPLVVIGGMTPANAAPLVARGADMVAAISSVYQAASVGEAVGQFAQLFVVHNNRKSFGRTGLSAL